MLDRINESLRPLARPLAALKPDPENARRHPDRNLETIKHSLTQFGQQKAIVVAPDGTILAGNGTYQAATALGWTHLAAVVFEGDRAKLRASALADNRTAELAEWDYAALSKGLIELRDFGLDLGGIGWLDYEAGPLLQATWAPPALEPDAPTSAGVQGPVTVEFTPEQWSAVERGLNAYFGSMKGGPVRPKNDAQALVTLTQSFIPAQTK